MGINKDAFNNLAWELRLQEENQGPQAELIIASRRQLEGILAESGIEFNREVFDDLEGIGGRELIKQLSPTRAVYKRPEKRCTGGGWDVMEANYWRLEVVDAKELGEETEPEFYITVMPSEDDGVFEEGVMPKIHVVDVYRNGYLYPVGGRLHPNVHEEPSVQTSLDEIIDALSS